MEVHVCGSLRAAAAHQDRCCCRYSRPVYRQGPHDDTAAEERYFGRFVDAEHTSRPGWSWRHDDLAPASITLDRSYLRTHRCNVSQPNFLGWLIIDSLIALRVLANGSIT